MIDFIKNLIGNYKAFVLIVFILLLLVAIIGQIPISKDLSKSIQFTNLQRLFFFGGAILWIFIAWFIDRNLRSSETITPPKNLEWGKRVKETNKEIERIKSDPNIKKILEENAVLFSQTINGVLFNILVGDIVQTDTDVIVSSDDNYLQAAGGVAKAIIKSAGKIVEEELNVLRNKGLIKLSHVAVTTAGNLNAKCIFHPAIIDLKRNIYPDENVIRRTTKYCLECAKCMGLTSISFPILGGGTGSRNLKAHQSFRFIIEEIVKYIKEEPNFDFIVLYVFNISDAGSNIEEFMKEEIEKF